MADMHRDTLDLNHKLNNPLFASWKLSRALSVSEQTVTLNGHVSTSEHNPDYLNTRAAVLHNHINHQHGRLYIFCISAESLSLQEICQPQATVLKTVWEPSQAIQTANPNTKHGASMQPSVVELQPLEPTHVGRQLLVSTGQGDVSLLKTAETTTGTDPCYPLKLIPSSDEAQCFHLETAHEVSPGQIDVIAWAIQKKSGTETAGCQVFCITLVHQAGQLSVKKTQLLQVCALPPHSVSQPIQDTLILATTDPVRNQPEAKSAAVVPHSGPSNDDDGDDISPRTLRQAADRLAKFTSDQPADALQQNEFSDLYSEVGPDNVGGMGNEPSCTLTLFTKCQDTSQPCTHATTATSQHHEAGNCHTADQPQSSVNQTETASATSAVTVASDSTPAAVLDSFPAASAQVESTSPGDIAAPAQMSPVAASANQDPASSTTGQTLNDKLPSSGPHAGLDSDANYEAVMQISCRPHDVVASQAGHPHPMLLGLSDDVDCAVVSVSAAGQQLQAQHTASIPALAYVAAGKVHKKFVLLAHSDSPLAAAVVEGHRFSYIYRKTASKQGSGESQIIDMGLQKESEAVLGAALHWEGGQDTLFILTETQLRVYSINVS